MCCLRHPPPKLWSSTVSFCIMLCIHGSVGPGLNCVLQLNQQQRWRYGWVRFFNPQANGWVFEFQTRHKSLKQVVTAPLLTAGKDALCQVWLKLAQWLWRRRFLNFVNVYLLFRNYLPINLRKNLNHLHPTMLCAKFG